MTTANAIREYVKNYLIDPARRKGERTITFRASEIHKAMKLVSSYPLVCSSIDTDKFLDFAPVGLVRRVGPFRSSTVQWTFDLLPERNPQATSPTTSNMKLTTTLASKADVFLAKQDLIPSPIYRDTNTETSASLKKIIDLGFEDVGYWFLDGERISYSLTASAKESNILYSFVVNGDVKYVGKSIQTLYKRMYLYKQGGGTQITNIRNRREIKSCLERGMVVRIYVFIQRDPMRYKEMPVNIAAGLEDYLIFLLKPAWNKR